MRKKPLAFVILASLSVLIVVGVFQVGGFVFNLSRSLPIGIYQHHQMKPVVGSLVLFCVPDRLVHLEVFQRATVKVCIHGEGAPLLKRVVAIDEETGAITVMGDTPRSIDSRWFGPLFADEIEAVAEPIWTVASGKQP